jgi:predicted Zn-dependent protease
LAGDSDGAIRNLGAAARLDARAASLLEGVRYLKLGQAAQALEPLQKALRDDPDDTDVRQVLADALYLSGHFQPAAAELIRVTDAAPWNTRAWYVLGRTWAALARGTYEELLGQTPPDSALGLAVAADGLIERHLYRRALVVYRQALKKDPTLVTVRARVAEIYRLNGRADWAAKEEASIAAFDCSTPKPACQARAGEHTALLAATLRGSSPEDLYWQAQAYTGLANEAFAKLERLPPSVELHRYRAGLAWEAGEHAAMVEELRKALALAPQDRGLRRDLAMALAGAGVYGESFQMARELLRQEPASPELNALAGTALLSDEKAEEAIPFLSEALAAEPNNLPVHASLGRALLKTGQAKLALPHLVAAATTDKDGSLHFQLARAYQQTGQPEPAKAAMGEYQRLAAKPVFPPEPALVPPEE